MVCSSLHEKNLYISWQMATPPDPSSICCDALCCHCSSLCRCSSRLAMTSTGTHWSVHWLRWPMRSTLIKEEVTYVLFISQHGLTAAQTNECLSLQSIMMNTHSGVLYWGAAGMYSEVRKGGQDNWSWFTFLGNTDFSGTQIYAWYIQKNG